MTSPKVLIVDDDSFLLSALQRSVSLKFACDTAAGGAEAVRCVQTRGPYAVALVDMKMPSMNGIEVLERISQIAPDTIRMMLTSDGDQQTAIEAVNRGHVFRFLHKPAPVAALLAAIEMAMERYRHVRGERNLLENTLAGSIKMLTDVLGLSAPSALGHGQRLRDSVGQFARHLNAGPIWELELGALLSEIGCAAVPPSILEKVTTGVPLSLGEETIFRRVPRIGHDLLADIPRLAGVAEIVLYQRKHFDGTGYPADALAGEAIPLGARLLKILSDRLELEADGVVKQRAFETLQARRGFYDPALLIQCFICFDTFLAQTLTSDRRVLQLKAAQLAPGQVVVSDITTHAGHTLAPAGHRLTASSIQRIGNFADLGEVNEPFLVQEAPEAAGPAEFNAPSNNAPEPPLAR